MNRKAALKDPQSRLRAASPEVSAWVCANAGAGKTHLLVARVLRLLLAGTEASRILCVTYTRGAAAEMRGRILSALSGWVTLDDKVLHEELTDLCGMPPAPHTMARARSLFAMLADAPQGLRIDTLHAFCQSLLKCFPLEAGMAPYFSVIDERTARELLHEAAMRLFSESITGADAALRETVQALAARMSEMSFHDLLLDIARERRRLRGVLEGGREVATRHMHAFLRVSPGDSEASLLAEWLPGVEKRGEALEEYLAFHLTKEGKPRIRGFSKDSSILAEQDRVYHFYQRRRSLRAARMSGHLITVAHALMESYDALKRVHALADYDDLVTTATNLLSQPGVAPWVMYKLDGGIDHVLIDEAQDTSREQWHITQALTEEFFAGVGRSDATRTLFAVGDVKQSIFRFQGAAPKLFDDMRVFYGDRIPQSGHAWAEVDLPESFRSVQPVLQAVDAVFATHHALTRTGEGGLVEVWPLVEAEKEESVWQLPKAYVRRHGAAQVLAGQIASTIRGWLERGEAAAGDIMILVRRRGAVAKALLHALRQAGVPVAGADRLTLSDHLAVQDLLALGAFLLLPEDDLSLAALLKSPLFCVSEEELFTLAHGRTGSLWERLPEGSVRAQLAGLLAIADFQPPYELYAHLLDAQGGRTRFASRMGHAVHDVLDEFLAQALLYEQAHTPTLQGFLHWMAMAEVEIKRDMEQGVDAVRIMTVHAAKGLQAPIVILPDTGPLKVPSGRLLWAEDGGCLLWNAAAAEASPEIAALKQAQAAEEAEEYRRLLYVAMTRAEDRLYVCGIAVKRGTAEGSWHAMAWRGLESIAQKVQTPAGEGLRISSTPSPAGGGLGWGQPTQAAANIAPLLTSPLQGKEYPAWGRELAPQEEASRPLSPSRLFEDDLPAFSPVLEQKLYQRGTMLHRLLQYLPAVPAESRPDAASRLLERWGVAAGERAALAGEVLALFSQPAFAPFFGPDSLAEVPLSGVVRMNGKNISIAGQVDRLAVTEQEVWVLDYKTYAVPPATVPLRYLRQMAAYRALLSGIYPGRRVRCALLWTAGPKLVELKEGDLDAAASRP